MGRNPTNLIKSHKSNYVNPIGSIYSDNPIKKNIWSDLKDFSRSDYL